MGIYDSMVKTMLQGFINSQIPEDIGRIELTKYEKQSRYVVGTLLLKGEQKEISFNFNYNIYNLEGKYYIKIINFFADRIWINNAVRIYQKNEGKELPNSAANIISMLL
jgi:hypothetical protein